MGSEIVLEKLDISIDRLAFDCLLSVGAYLLADIAPPGRSVFFNVRFFSIGKLALLLR